MENTKITAVSDTAIAMAAVRACESQRADALFHDPFAAILAGDAAVETARLTVERDDRQGRPFGQVRTRFLDDFLMRCVTDRAQVVLLGAGLDTRAYRLDLPSHLRWFEVDRPEIVSYKAERLAAEMPTCDRQTIAIDLADASWPDALVEAGFQPDRPTIWLLEGLVYYLTEPQATDLFSAIDRLSAPGSQLAADFINPTVCNGEEAWADLWHFGCDEPEQFLQQFGWDAVAVQPSDPEASYGRFTLEFPPRDDRDGMHIFFVTAERQGAQPSERTSETP